MKKTLLITFALFLSSLAFSARYDLPLANLGSSGWGGFTTDGEGSITYVSAWTGCGWWLDPSDFSSYKKLVIIFEELPFPMRIVVEYDGADNSTVDISTGLTKGEVELDPDGASHVKQVYLQSGNDGVGTIVVKEAYLTDGEDEEVSYNSVYDFESDAIGMVYPVMHAWGWPDANSSAKIEADPLETSEKSLKVKAGNYDGLVYFTVTLPEDFTVADITGIQFDSYFGDIEQQHAAVELFIAPRNAAIGNGVNFNSYPIYLKTSDSDSKPSPVIQVSEPGEWYTISFTREQICDEDFNFGNKFDFNAVDGLSEFLFGIGISGPNGTEYYMDNIKFILSNETGIIPVAPSISKMYGVKGGIVFTTNNEIVSIFGVDGRLIKNTVANQGTQINLPQGLYIVKIGAAHTAKVLVR